MIPDPETTIPEHIDAMVNTIFSEESVQSRVDSEAWQTLNHLDRALAEFPQQEMPLLHVFTRDKEGKPNLYTRQIFMPKGTLLTTRIHITEHPFIISEGSVSVWSDGKWSYFSAPHIGITTPGTRRAIYVHRDCIWTTCHVTSEIDPDVIVKQLTHDHMSLGHMNCVDKEKVDAVKRNAQAKLS